ncbi:hypothetical protein MMC25_001547 [Agyrium rufum]|nr:hypothetical protein [Agyrium rufum]
MDSTIKTRILIVSDTHGMDFTPEDRPLQHADVAIHCGALTDGPTWTSSELPSNYSRAVAKAQPRIHCFGHIHEGWGAKLATWRDQVSGPPTHLNAVDNGNSHMIEKLAGLKPSEYDTDEDAQQRKLKVERYAEKWIATSLCSGDERPLEYSDQTLFVNAAFSGDAEGPVQRPWLIDIELNRAQQSWLQMPSESIPHIDQTSKSRLSTDRTEKSRYCQRFDPYRKPLRHNLTTTQPHLTIE